MNSPDFLVKETTGSFTGENSSLGVLGVGQHGASLQVLEEVDLPDPLCRAYGVVPAQLHTHKHTQRNHKTAVQVHKSFFYTLI